MSDKTKFTVAKMSHAFVAEDSSAVQLEFEDENGELLKLAFDSEQFEKFASNAIQMFTHTRNQRLSKGDHLAIHPVAAGATMADAPIGGGKVILAVHADNGVPYSFSISPEEALELRRQLLPAAKAAKKQASEPRH